MKAAKHTLRRSGQSCSGEKTALRPNVYNVDASVRAYAGRGSNRDSSNHAQFSQAHHVDKDTKSYFTMACERFQEDFEDDEDKALFLENVADQTCGKEVQLSCDDSTSRCMQMLLINTRNISVLTRFMSSFLDSVNLMCTDHSGAFVIQTLLEAALRYLQSPTTYTASEEDFKYTEAISKHGDNTAKNGAVGGKKCLGTSQDSLQDIDNSNMQSLASGHDKVVSWVLAIGRFCLENIKEFLFSGMPAHVTRSVVQVLGGCYVERHLSRHQPSQKRRRTRTEAQKNPVEVVEVPEEYDELFGIYVETIKTQFDMLDIMANNVASMILQALIMILQLKNPKLLSVFVKHITKAVFSQAPNGERVLPPAFLDPSASFTVEELLKRCSAKTFTKLWNNHISGILLQMSLHPVSTFCAQRVIEYATSSEQFQEMYEELEPGFDSLFDHGQISMLVCIAAACKTHSVNQARFVKALMTTLHCADPEDRHPLLTPLILYMKRYEEFDKAQQGTSVVYQGSLLLQHLLRFGKTQKVSQSLLNMGSQALKAIACCPCGSHVLDAFVQSDHVKKTSKEELIGMLKGQYASLAMDKYGSCFVMNLWDIANIAQKTDIAEELSDKESALAASICGKLVSKKLCLYHFIHRRNDWTELQKTSKKTSLLFQDILKEK
ncbi:nucleolar protein 9 isoform X1 [Dermacentor albipictus]|uniref:nucleolar protein 9 isoform X1 n=1 Tax=Dermacentor albipictus TaxID=60249 RepID=UPI0031FBEB48